jgi:hypothetical protein
VPRARQTATLTPDLKTDCLRCSFYRGGTVTNAAMRAAASLSASTSQRHAAAPVRDQRFDVLVPTQGLHTFADS